MQFLLFFSSTLTILSFHIHLMGKTQEIKIVVVKNYMFFACGRTIFFGISQLPTSVKLPKNSSSHFLFATFKFSSNLNLTLFSNQLYFWCVCECKINEAIVKLSQFLVDLINF